MSKRGVLQSRNFSETRTGLGRRIIAILTVAALFGTVWTLSSAKVDPVRSSQFGSLAERYLICSPDPRSGHLDLRLAGSHAGSVYTGDETRFSTHEGFTQCVGIDKGVITHVGTEQDVIDSFCGRSTSNPTLKGRRRAARSNKAARLLKNPAAKSGPLGKRPQCDIRRLRSGQTLFPGFHDAHGHILDYGWSRTVANLVGSTSVDEAISRLEDYVRARPRLLAHALTQDNHTSSNAELPWIEGIGWDQTKWTPAKFPTASDFARSPLLKRFPIILRRVDVHAVWLSQVGLDLIVERAAGFPKSPEEDKRVQGGLVVRDDDGKPTGILVDNAMNFAYEVVPKWTDEQRKVFLDAATEGLLKVGITAVGDAATDIAAAEFYKRMDVQGHLKFRVYSMLACPPGKRRCAEDVEQARSGDKFTLRAVKLFNDGALGSWGSAMWEAYNDKPGERGLLLIPEEELPGVVEYWLERGWQVCTHAIGDRANTLTLDAYESFLSSHPENRGDRLRPRVEHAQLMRPSDLHRLSELGVVASMQPTHCTSDMGYVESRIGHDRAKNGAYAWKSLLNLNASLALGSDFPVELPDPLHGIYSAITRLDANGESPHGKRGWFPHEKLTRREALNGFTQAAAFAQFEEHLAGSIAVGKRADFTLLDRNILDEDRVNAAEVREAKVDATIVGGKVEFDRIAAESLAMSMQTTSRIYGETLERIQVITSMSLFRPRPSDVSVVWFAMLAGLLIAFLLRSGDREPYTSLSCLALNTPAPTTAWMNMGFWSPQASRPSARLDFALACQTLAEELYSAAGLTRGRKVLDVGCGAGQSTLFLLEHFRPKVLHAVTSLPDEAKYASARLEETMGELEVETEVKVWRADVMDWLRRNEGNGEKYDVILALDCAFHFSDRAEYIRLASKRLNRGGKLAFVDLLSAYPTPRASESVLLGNPAYPRHPPSLSDRLKHNLTCMLASVRPASLWSVDRYLSTLLTEGRFEEDRVKMQDITGDVFAGFSRFLKSFAAEGGAWRGGGWLMRRGLGGFSNVVKGWSEQGGLVRMFIIVAEKDESS